jgi:transcription-repair coupling factor (superfamily II helicase)
MYNKSKILSDIAKKRLNVIKDFTELGSGFSIAMRDLSIRGAGDILGSQQAGFIDSVGVELFMNMLNEEVNKIKGKEVQKEDTKANPLIDVETTIADNYVSDEDLKIEIHQKINSIDSLDKLKQVKSELEDRFGKINESIEIYMYEQLLEYNFNKIGITDIRQTKNSISVIISKELLKIINTDDLFVNVTSLSRNFRFASKFNQLHITLDIVNLDKHFIYYLIDLSNILNNSLKTIDK